ncbi:MAG: ribose-phosphate pyrophosphokinase [Bacteroidaceae bacterium]|nr:ribose-phosphate pyrophosphokinase [Bacteroidaceae bacterium]
MIKCNDVPVTVGHFPDGTTLFDKNVKELLSYASARIEWWFENNEEMTTLWYLVHYLRDHGYSYIRLHMPYIPNARMDRVKNDGDVFTLKYFAKFINSLGFEKVTVLDPHSYVSEALIDRVEVLTPWPHIMNAMEECTPDMLFFPDEGAMKRLSSMFHTEYAFGIKKRDWATGKILGLDIAGCVDKINGSKILIADDICSRGGTFYHSALKLKELGAKEVYLYVTHCENTILEGELLTSGLIEKVYTTNSIFTKEHERIEVLSV